MPARAKIRPVCHNCDNFPVVAIATGARHRDGSRVLLHVVCHVCGGTGYAHHAPVALAQAGK